MKRTFLVLIAAVIAQFARAQIQFGVKAGYNLASLRVSTPQPQVSSKPGFNAGVMASVPLFSRCSLQPEIMYSGQGIHFIGDLTSGTQYYDWLNVPVLFTYQHPTGLFAETGPQFGFLLSARESERGQSFDISNSIRSADFSWVFGIGYRLPFGLGMDARYNLGLTSIARNYAFGDGTAKNMVFQFGLFFQH
jgi:Outer membrane protein beta-barrel domain